MTDLNEEFELSRIIICINKN
eukprot:SAG22_NODE_9163_length_606_cov_1.120316_3_plen_20_part_01